MPPAALELDTLASNATDSDEILSDYELSDEQSGGAAAKASTPRRWTTYALCAHAVLQVRWLLVGLALYDAIPWAPIVGLFSLLCATLSAPPAYAAYFCARQSGAAPTAFAARWLALAVWLALEGIGGLRLFRKALDVRGVGSFSFLREPCPSRAWPEDVSCPQNLGWGTLQGAIYGASVLAWADLLAALGAAAGCAYLARQGWGAPPTRSQEGGTTGDDGSISTSTAFCLATSLLPCTRSRTVGTVVVGGGGAALADEDEVTMDGDVAVALDVAEQRAARNGEGVSDRGGGGGCSLSCCLCMGVRFSRDGRVDGAARGCLYLYFILLLLLALTGGSVLYTATSGPALRPAPSGTEGYDAALAGTCDPLVPAPASCLLPFPSDFYQKVDLSGVKSKSGYVMSIPAAAMPMTRTGRVLSAKSWNRKDGFSTIAPLLFSLGADVDDGNLLRAAVLNAKGMRSDNGATDGAGRPTTELVHVETGTRVAHFVERDYYDTTGDGLVPPLLVLQPAVPLNYSARYVVAVRGLKSRANKQLLLQPSPAFAGILAGDKRAQSGASNGEKVHSAVPTARSLQFQNSILPLFPDRGADLQLAWSFVTGSSSSLIGDALTVRDGALRAGQQAPASAVQRPPQVDPPPHDGYTPKRSAGCATAAGATELGKLKPGSTSSVKITVQGVKRTFLVHIPYHQNASTAVPLLVDFHGWGGSGASVSGAHGFNELSDSLSPGFVVAYPDGMSDNGRGRWGSWNCAGCSNTGSAKARGFSVCDHNSADMCYDSCEAGVSAGAPGGHESKTCPKTDFLGKGECDWCTCVDDISFVVAMTTKLRSELCIDERRMHSTGMSNGGMMAYQMAYSLPTLFASTAPVAGSMHIGFQNLPAKNFRSTVTSTNTTQYPPAEASSTPYVKGSGNVPNPQAAISVLDVHGTSDTTVPSIGNEGKPGEQSCGSDEGKPGEQAALRKKLCGYVRPDGQTTRGPDSSGLLADECAVATADGGNWVYASARTMGKLWVQYNGGRPCVFDPRGYRACVAAADLAAFLRSNPIAKTKKLDCGEVGFDLRYGARVTRCTWDGPHQFPGAGRRDTDKWGARLVWTWMRGLHKQDGQSPPTPPPNKAPPPPLQQSSQGMKVPPHEITAVKDEKCDGSSSDSWRKGAHSKIGRTVWGKFTTPNFLRIAYSGADTSFARDADGRLVSKGTKEVNFVLRVPCSLLNGAKPASMLLQYGHGLFGSRAEVLYGSSQQTAEQYLTKLADDNGWILFATDWAGMAQFDVITALRVMVARLDEMSSIPERTAQGFADNAVALRLATLGLSQEPSLQTTSGVALLPAGTKSGYYGNSQGSVIGGGYVSLSPDLQRAVLGVPGCPYALLLSRSKDFAPYHAALKMQLSSEQDVRLALSLMQQLWDMGDSAGYLRHMNLEPLAGCQPKEVLLQAALGDKQVTPLGAEIMARAYGASTVSPQTRSVFGLRERKAPFAGSALVEWQIKGVPAAPDRDVAPLASSADTHECPRRQCPAQRQLAEFLSGKPIGQYCSGKCVAQKCKEDACS